MGDQETTAAASGPTGIGNREFIERHAAPGRIGLCTGKEWMSKLIRKAQSPLTGDGHRSLWSHAFIFNERRADGHWWVLESDLDIHYKQVRLGVQENRVDRYFDSADVPNLAILDFGLDDAQVKQVQIAGLELLSGLSHYSLTELIGTLLAMPSRRLRRHGNVLARNNALFCSAMVQHCYAAASLHLLPELGGKHITPQDIAESPLPHQSHRLIRDLGVSHLRRIGRRTEALVDDLLGS
ncbi:hypothetical protein [Solilutibacter silvestris]|uniref:Uncharacterized protein n=1 Tax=Solilutibacter silvestris TaxID=1645665 RepID=A0A2K1PYN5_9GAMM|nr:hypothetical protein [Lysobacter silvestris]PNS07906.1 hypothetical protein Lysil_2082 [Lysobacter silvestris]